MLGAVGFAVGGALFNRWLGGGLNPWPTGEKGDWIGKRLLPGKPLTWGFGFLGLGLMPLFAWQIAWLWSVSFYIWRLLPWGLWFDMGLLPWYFGKLGYRPSPFEKAINSVSFGSKKLAMFWRFLVTSVGVLPLMYYATDMTTGWSYYAVPMLCQALLSWSCYFIGFVLYKYILRMIWPTLYNTIVAEYLCGSCWGLTIYVTWQASIGAITL